jgi:hypothetical protein
VADAGKSARRSGSIRSSVVSGGGTSGGFRCAKPFSRCGRDLPRGGRRERVARSTASVPIAGACASAALRAGDTGTPVRWGIKAAELSRTPGCVRINPMRRHLSPRAGRGRPRLQGRVRGVFHTPRLLNEPSRRTRGEELEAPAPVFWTIGRIIGFPSPSVGGRGCANRLFAARSDPSRAPSVAGARPARHPEAAPGRSRGAPIAAELCGARAHRAKLGQTYEAEAPVKLLERIAPALASP